MDGKIKVNPHKIEMERTQERYRRHHHHRRRRRRHNYHRHTYLCTYHSRTPNFMAWMSSETVTPE